MQFLYKVNARVTVQPCARSVLLGTSRNEIETTGVKLEKPVERYSQCLETTERKHWLRLHYTRKGHCYTSNSSNICLAFFFTTTDDYMMPCLLIMLLYTVQMHIP